MTKRSVAGQVPDPFIALAQEKSVVWVSDLPLLPLALLWFTRMYLIVLPHAIKWRSGRRTG